MLLLLQSRGRVTAAEIAAKLEVSPRTVYRDAEALSLAGVPIYAERGRGGGISLLPGYRSDLTGLTLDESKALFVLTTGGAQADLGLGGPLLRSALAKVLRAVPAPYRDSATAVGERILVDPAGWMRPAEQSPWLGALQAAVFADRRVRLQYRSMTQSGASDRVVDPYGLVSKSGIWYLVADHDGSPRLYRVSRISGVSCLDDEPVRRRPEANLAGLWEELRRRVDGRPMPVRVVARVRRSRLDMFSRICAANIAREPRDPGEPDEAGELPCEPGELPGGDDEWAELELRFPAVKAARIMLGFGMDVRIVSPLEVAADFAAVAADVVAAYSERSFSAGLAAWRRP
jgi:predicted DNA-binding transcriptional regulator YafY